MTQAGIHKFTAPDFSAALRQGSPSLEIAPDAEIPAAYWRPQDPKLDKLMLLAAVKNGLDDRRRHLGGAPHCNSASGPSECHSPTSSARR